MKITFERVRMKNFLSIGNDPVEISLDEYKTNLIFGSNGSGKSSLLTAIPFALFGKTSRKINKPQYVNSINKKQCVVDLWFTINGITSYKITRGIKPDFFEIYNLTENRKIDQNASVYDYQDHFEKEIVRLNYHTFHQIVTLSSSSYTPFMLLPASKRREVIEDILDISVFSKMREVLKIKQASTSKKIGAIEQDLILTKQELKHIKEINQLIKQQEESKQKEIKGKIQSLNNEISEIEKQIVDKESQRELFYEELGQLQDSSPAIDINENLQKLKSSKQKILFSMKESEKKIGFFKENDLCTTCQQPITDEIKEKASKKEKKLIESNVGVLEELNKIQITLEEKVQKEVGISRKISSLNDAIRLLEHTKTSKRKEIDSLVYETSSQSSQSSQTTQDIKDETVFSQKIIDLSELKEKKELESHYYTIIEDLLKDKNGIKSSLVKNYIPVINKILNEYLQMFDFFVSFTFDENFNEVIKSRYRDQFSYESFSEGQKARIDLAILFVWRKISELRNSTQTNLLILDEVFQSNLDEVGVEKLVDILTAVNYNTSVFVISHSPEIKGMEFSRRIHVKMNTNNFTTIQQSKHNEIPKEELNNV